MNLIDTFSRTLSLSLFLIRFLFGRTLFLFLLSWSSVALLCGLILSIFQILLVSNAVLPPMPSLVTMRAGIRVEIIQGHCPLCGLGRVLMLPNPSVGKLDERLEG